MDDLNELIFKRFDIRGRYRRDGPPWLSHRGKRETLADLFNELGWTVGAEIGTRVGKYAIELCKRNPKLHLYCVDPWNNYTPKYPQDKQDGIYEQAVKNLAPYNVTIMRKTSMEAVTEFEDGSLDFVHIDGNHEFDYACPDLIYWSKKVKKGGIVSLHDYYHFYLSGVVEAVNAYTTCHAIYPWYVTKQLEPMAFWVNP